MCNIPDLSWVVSTRLTVSFVNCLFCFPYQTLMNAKHQYVAPVVCAYIIMVIMGAVAFKTAGGSLFNIYRLTSQHTHRDY